MIFAIYDPITRELACSFDAYSGEFQSYGRFEVKEYPDDVGLVVDAYDDGTMLLVENAVILTPQYFSDEEREDYDDEEEEDD